MRRIALGFVIAATALSVAHAQHKAGGTWIADASGCRIWREEARLSLSVTWSGPCARGLAAGKGVLEWYEAGRLEGRYEGEMRGGHYFGQGVYTWSNGERYWGEIRNSRRDGRGFFLWANGDRYDGEWKGGRRNGHGVYVWANGGRYEGAWKDDRAHGEGTYRTADGNVYPGNWVRGCLRDGDRRAWVGADSSACK